MLKRERPAVSAAGMNRRKFFGGRPDALSSWHRVIHEMAPVRYERISEDRR
jgi:hypothetical protein